MGTLSRQALLGSWDLIGVSLTWRTHLVRICARGTLIYTPGGDISVVMTVSPLPVFVLHKTIAYTGCFRLEGDEAVHQVTTGTWPFNQGKTLRRRATLLPDGGLRLALAGKGSAVALSLTWQQAHDRYTPAASPQLR